MEIVLYLNFLKSMIKIIILFAKWRALFQVFV